MDCTIVGALDFGYVNIKLSHIYIRISGFNTSTVLIYFGQKIPLCFYYNSFSSLLLLESLGIT